MLRVRVVSVLGFCRLRSRCALRLDARTLTRGVLALVKDKHKIVSVSNCTYIVFMSPKVFVVKTKNKHNLHWYSMQNCLDNICVVLNPRILNPKNTGRQYMSGIRRQLLQFPRRNSVPEVVDFAGTAAILAALPSEIRARRICAVPARESKYRDERWNHRSLWNRFGKCISCPRAPCPCRSYNSRIN
jgi:hypothetical protein